MHPGEENKTIIPEEDAVPVEDPVPCGGAVIAIQTFGDFLNPTAAFSAPIIERGPREYPDRRGLIAPSGQSSWQQKQPTHPLRSTLADDPSLRFSPSVVMKRRRWFYLQGLRPRPTASGS